MGYEYEDLDDSQFERLVVQVMRKLFGAGVQDFAAGRDGGRDALFNGTAERFPSSTKPWTGKTVGQAKHTNALNAHYSDPDFSGSAESSVLTKELVRIKNLVQAGDLDNYILFSNRRLGAITASELTKRIATEVGIAEERVFLAGLEYLDQMLHEHRDLITLARIIPADGPLIASSQDCAEVILAISAVLSTPPPVGTQVPVERVSYAEKNRLNQMTLEFAEALSKRYLIETRQIESFLADPGNNEIRMLYESAVDDFQLKIIAIDRSISLSITCITTWLTCCLSAMGFSLAISG
ncbi:hypothetical protein MBOU_57640 [Mycobacterium bourgelatii]|uniref:ABC-three component systems C-terminal domain-containing protein n=1 Tax=Mycobacterium bourgelatii TaxID=1273442 RepID=A0A7I9YYS6_MYCBU|nr:ABC-three component system protein [Mycobacterium bourgelatii]GFG93722.1 hypothetical protein MBOU_57640 [Mycobacterium bourgelatii]